MNRDDLCKILAPLGQSHLLDFWDELDEAQRRVLAGEIRQIDFALVAALWERKGPARDFTLLARRMTPPSAAIRLGAAGNPFSPEAARHRGDEALRAGRVGVILVAGGQGTRLGFPHPKGMFPIGPVSGKSLFQILIEKILARSRRCGAAVPLYVMTSPATHAETAAYLGRNNRFGLAEQDLTLFCQATMPAVDADTGKVLLAERHRVALSPDGHGGTLAALVRSGCLEAMRRRGLRHLFYMQVDNPLVDVCSPEFIGYHLLAESEMSTQVVAKRTPLDRLGNVVEVEGRLHAIEYIHWPEVIAQRPEAGDPARFWAGSIAVHVFELEFLERMAQDPGALPFHVSDRKRVAYVDPSGRRIEPQSPNALKFERFIFDLLPSAQRPVVMEVDAGRHFAPLKNAPGQEADTPETVRQQMIALHSEWLRQAGASVAEGVAVEISPLLALDASELAAKIPPGTQVMGPREFA